MNTIENNKAIVAMGMYDQIATYQNKPTIATTTTKTTKTTKIKNKNSKNVSLATIDKQAELTNIVTTHLNYYDGLDLNGGKYLYVDANGGKGEWLLELEVSNPEGKRSMTARLIDGSPVITYRLLTKHPKLNPELIVMECNPDYLLSLRNVLTKKFPGVHFNLFPVDNGKSVKIVEAFSDDNTVGLIHFDHNGLPPVHTIQDYGTKFQNLDILCRISATTSLRAMGHFGISSPTRDIVRCKTPFTNRTGFLRQWLISEPQGRAGWYWLFGTYNTERLIYMASNVEIFFPCSQRRGRSDLYGSVDNWKIMNLAGRQILQYVTTIKSRAA